MQDFKFALLDMPDADRRVHFAEVQALHGRGKPGLVVRWVARALGGQQQQQQQQP